MSKITSAYVADDNAGIRKALAKRTIDNQIPYIKEYLSELPEDFIFLDVGCGPGSLTIEVASRYPQATVLGVDGSEDSLADARQAAEKAGVGNIAFYFGDALNLADNTHLKELVNKCDIVHCHMVLQHLTDPTQGLRQMRAMAREAGGLVAAREADIAGCVIYPGLPELIKSVPEYIEFAHSRGANPLTGRKLVHLAIDAGFQLDNVKGSVDGLMSFSSVTEKKAWVGLLASGWKAADDAEDANDRVPLFGSPEARKDWYKWVDTPGSWCFLPCCRIVARKD